MRASGIILHITSLPSPHGVGTLGREAREFADFLRKAGQKYWQILPLGPTGYGDSPYQTDSAFAARKSMPFPSAATRRRRITARSTPDGSIFSAAPVSAAGTKSVRT